MKNNFFYKLLAFILILNSCSGTKKVSKTEEVKQDVIVVNNSNLELGKSIYESKCGSCHALKQVNQYDAESWKSIVPNMVGKTNKKANTTAIDSSGHAALLQYVLANCKK